MFNEPQGALFNDNRSKRYVLWRYWDVQQETLLIIGLNPSIADESEDDPTTKRLIAHAKRLGFGGILLVNCFATIATNPKKLVAEKTDAENLKWIHQAAACAAVVLFAWGKNHLVSASGLDRYFSARFPHAKCLGTNLDGSPKHPLYLSYQTKLRSYDLECL